MAIKVRYATGTIITYRQATHVDFAEKGWLNLWTENPEKNPKADWIGAVNSQAVLSVEEFDIETDETISIPMMDRSTGDDT